MKGKSGFIIDIGKAPPPDQIGKAMKTPAKPDDAPEDDMDSGSTDNAGAISAVHDLARALGVEVKDEDAAVSAFYDLMKCAPKDEDE